MKPHPVLSLSLSNKVPGIWPDQIISLRCQYTRLCYIWMTDSSHRSLNVPYMSKKNQSLGKWFEEVPELTVWVILIFTLSELSRSDPVILLYRNASSSNINVTIWEKRVKWIYIGDEDEKVFPLNLRSPYRTESPSIQSHRDSSYEVRLSRTFIFKRPVLVEVLSFRGNSFYWGNVWPIRWTGPWVSSPNGEWEFSGVHGEYRDTVSTNTVRLVSTI